LHTKEWTVSGTADESNPEVRALIDRLNSKIQNDGSGSTISALLSLMIFILKEEI